MLVEPAQPSRHEVLERPHSTQIVRPPLVGNFVIDREVIAHGGHPLRGLGGAKRGHADTVTVKLLTVAR